MFGNGKRMTRNVVAEELFSINMNIVIVDRAEKRLRMRAVDSFWRVFDRLINEVLPP